MISAEKREYNRRYYLAHREVLIRKQTSRDALRRDEVRAYKKRHHAENRAADNERARLNWERLKADHPELIKRYSRDHYVRHRDEILERHSVEYERSKEQRRAKHREWQRANRAKMNCLVGRHRTRKMLADGSHTTKEWLAKIIEYGRACAYCGATDIVLTEDHVIPLSKGGSDYISNIVPACRRCNSRKRDKPAESMHKRGGDSDVIEVC